MRFRRIFVSSFLLLCGCVAAYASSGVQTLPTVVRQGKSYYEYQVKEGDSLYGIAKAMGWDYDLLDGLNPGATDKLRRGDRLIYPVGDDSATMADTGNSAPAPRSGKVTYDVTGSTNPYEVAKLLGVTTDELYAQNPAARRGLRKGDKVTINYDLIAAGGLKPVYEVELTDKEDIGDRMAGKFKHQTTEFPSLPKTDDVAPAVHAQLAPSSDDVYHGRSERNPLVGLDRDMLMEYTVQPGDNPGIIAENFNTTVRDIYFLNKGVSDYWFPEGTVIRLLPGSKDLDHRRVQLNERILTSETTYKVRKGDTWQSIASTAGITEDELLKANEGVSLRKGAKIKVPSFTDRSKWEDVVFTDPREETVEGREQIRSEVNVSARSSRNDEECRNVVVLTSTESGDLKRDREFLRGFLLGVSDTPTRGRKVNVQVIEISDNRPVSSCLNSTAGNCPDLVVATFEKDFPADLADYGAENGVGIVNVFDAKSSLYTDNADMFQILQPSDMFNASIADDVLSRFGSRRIIFTGDTQGESDSFISVLKSSLKARGKGFDTYDSPASLRELDLNDFPKGIVVVSNAGSQSAISNTLQAVQSLRESYPTVPVAVVGRPTWIVHASRLKQLMKSSDTYIPSRFFYDTSSAPFEKFDSRFEKVYNVNPVVSYPPYAAMGYDVARYFISSMLANGGDFNKDVATPEAVQIGFDFKRVSAHSGLVNEAAYWIHYDNKGVEGIEF